MTAPDNARAASRSAWLLLEVASEAVDLWEEAEFADLFAHFMESPVADYVSDCSDTELTVRQVVSADAGEGIMLGPLRDWAKRDAVDGGRCLPSEVSRGVYFLAIAVGLARTGRRLSGLPDEALREGFTWLLGRDWLPGDLSGLVQDAIRKLS